MLVDPHGPIFSFPERGTKAAFVERFPGSGFGDCIIRDKPFTQIETFRALENTCTNWIEVVGISSVHSSLPRSIRFILMESGRRSGVQVECVCLCAQWIYKEEVTSCLGKLADVCKVGVVEDGTDPL